MLIDINVGPGKAMMSNDLRSVGGAVSFTPHRDVLDAFKQCSFQSFSQFNYWLARFRDAHSGASRSFLAKTMLKEHSQYVEE